MRELRRQLFVILSLSINHAALFMVARFMKLGLLEYLVIVFFLTIIASPLLSDLLETIVSVLLSLGGGYLIALGITIAMPVMFAEPMVVPLLAISNFVLKLVILAGLFGCLLGALVGWILADSLL